MPTRLSPPLTASAALLGAALFAMPAGAQQTTTAQPTATTQSVSVPAPGPRRANGATQQEDIIITPRIYPNPEEDDAFHRAEYERLNAIYGRPVPLNTRADTLMDVPLGKLPQDRSALRAIIADPDTPHLSQVVSPESK